MLTIKIMNSLPSAIQEKLYNPCSLLITNLGNRAKKAKNIDAFIFSSNDLFYYLLENAK